MKSNLGLFDMVLSLSINKINSQFDWILDRKQVSKRWGFLTDKQGEKFVNDNKTFADSLAKWKEAFDPQIATQLVELQTRIDAAIDAEDFEEVSRLQKQKKELEKRKDPKNPFRQYEYGLDAKIKCFTIELAKAVGFASAPLYFIIEIESGTLYYKKYNDKIKEFEILGATFKDGNYAFKVNVGKKLIKVAEMVLDENDRKDLIVKNDITDADFEVTALLMDFQNANISQYAKERTTIFDKVKGVDSELVTAMSLYFSKLAGTKENPNPHPFILGYKVEERTDKLTPALFNPTAIMHSTTDTTIAIDKDRNDPNYQSFNYLMQTSNHKLPDEKNNLTGILPYNLIEKKNDKSITTSGVFAIDYNLFVQKYIVEVLEPQLYSQLATQMAASLKDISVSNYGNEVYCTKPDLYFSLKLGSKTISEVTDQQKKGIKITWDITIEGKQNVDHERRLVGTVASHIFISTSGKFKIVPEGKKEKDVEAPRPGKLSVTLTTSNKGELELTSEKSDYSQPYIGTTTKDCIPDDPSFSWGDLFDIVKNFVPVLLLASLFASLLRDLSVHIDISSGAFQGFQMGNFKGFNNRVILPGSNNFTFKTIRLLNGSKNEDDAVLFDITHAEFEEGQNKKKEQKSA